MGAELAAPRVVAVVVAHRPGPWFEEVLRSLAAQDYPQLSVLVAAAGDDHDLAARVSAVLPDARFCLVRAGSGFPLAANEAVGAVTGVAHVLLCHDDVALAPGAVRLLLEEAYRSNAGLTCPKYVQWDAPDRLLSVGLGADRLGVTYPLVEPGELDQGQHDAVREVFVAPGGAVLVRRDLWEALSGFDPRIGGPGEDLEISWRAQLAGARIVVAPQAVARHLEATSRGLRAGPSPHNQLAQRDEHRLRTLWSCYSLAALVVVVPVTVFFVLAEVLWAAAHGRARHQVMAPLASLVGSLRRPGDLWSSRRQAQGQRRASDLLLWRAQARGSARLRALLRLRLEKGHELAWAAARAPETDHPSPPGSWKVALLTGAALLVVVLVGSRDLIGEGLPVLNQLPSATGGVGQWWSSWWSGPAAGGLGTLGAGRGFSPPGLALMGVLGIASFGSADLAVHIATLAPLIVGPLGAYVGARPYGPRRGQLAAMVLYAALPIAYNALSQGHWAGLVTYAAAPWALSGLCRLGGQPPHGRGEGAADWPRALALGLGLALAASLAPALLVVVPVMGAALCIGSVLAGQAEGGLRALSASVAVAVTAFVALLPWSFSLLGSWAALVGAPSGLAHGLSAGAVLRAQTGPFGGGPLGWALLVAGSTALFVGRGWRAAWGARSWAVALTFMALAWAAARGWLPSPPLEVLLAPAGAALVLAVAVGVAAVEADLPRYRFGWRQFAPPVAAAAAVAAAVPLLAWAGNGRWGVPASGAEEAYAFPSAAPSGDYRVLWAGAAGSVPAAPETSRAGVELATSADGLPTLGQLWAPTGSATAEQAAVVGYDLALAEGAETTALGHLLAPFSVRFIVVRPGPMTEPVTSALGRQVDLVPVGIDPMYEVYENTAWLPVFSVLAGRGSHVPEVPVVAPDRAWAADYQLQQAGLHAAAAVAVGTGGSSALAVASSLAGHTVYASVPPGSWGLRAGGVAVGPRPAGPGGSAWVLPKGARDIVLARSGSGGQQLGDLIMLVVWASAVAMAWARTRGRLGRQLSLASLAVGRAAGEVSGIDWPTAAEGPNLG